MRFTSCGAIQVMVTKRGFKVIQHILYSVKVNIDFVHNGDELGKGGKLQEEDGRHCHDFFI